jgi:outer membrane protein OmpA-like peptidoglycan-associated protein
VRFRRTHTTFVVGVVAALLLAACGGGGGEGGVEGGPENEPPAESSAATRGGTDAAPAEATEPDAPEEIIPFGTVDSDGDDTVQFVTTPSTTTSTTTTTTTDPPTTTTTSTTTTSTTSTSTTTALSTTIRCSLAADALFEPGEAVLNPAAIDELERIVDDVSEVRSVAVEGHTDHRGTDDENLALSHARADAAAAALIAAGIDEQLIRAVGLGESQAAQGDTSADQMAADRRVDIVIEADVPITTTC